MFDNVCVLCLGQHQVMGYPQHQVMGYPQAVLVKVGDEAILPCQVEQWSGETVEWSRPDLKPPFVLIHRSGRYLTADQNPLYKDRVSLFDQKLSEGNISLKLSRLRLSDQGNYTCSVLHLKSSSNVQLLVGKIQWSLLILKSRRPVNLYFIK